MMEHLQKKIIQLKQERNVAVVAHSYQQPEILEIADVTGDSFALALAAQQLQQKTVVLCGVRFMAEVVKTLSPDKTVLLAHSDATCPMAEQITPQQVRAFKKEHPDYKVVTYINTTNALKELADVCVTSSSAEQIINRMDGDQILFIPDQNLGAYIKNRVKNKQITLMDGCCPIHAALTEQEVLAAKQKHPEAKLLMHPECPPETLKHADLVGATSAILDYALKNEGSFIIGTEKGVYDYLCLKQPEKQFYLLSKKLICPDMKLTTLRHVLDCVNGTGGMEIKLEEQNRLAAKKCIDEMIRLGQS